MPTTTSMILDQISAEKTKISERLARLDADRAKIATQLIDLETAERVMARVSKTPARRSTSAGVAEAKPSTATRRRGRPPKAAQSSQRDAKPAHRASESAPFLWLPARLDRNFTRHVPTIARTMSA